MPEFDLDNLKKTWQEQPVTEKYNSDEILQMLNKKSRNYIKYILWISIVELLFFSIVNVFYFIQGNDSNGVINILERLGAKKTNEVEHNFNTIYFVLKVLSILTTFYFVIKFYQNYRKIKIEENIKEFIIRIINFKKTVNAFILISIALLLAFISIFTFYIFYALNSQSVHLNNSTLWGFIIGIIFSTVFCIVLIWVYYRLVYGIIMRKLDKNVKILQEIDSQKVS